MKKLTVEDIETKSADIVGENVEQLKVIFPEAFPEGKVDFEILCQLLGKFVDEGEEKYGLNWHGKRRARQIALTPSTGTLRPCPKDSVDWDTTQNLMIEGDNLEVLKLLQKSYAGEVKLIYIDPPYNTGKDFVYPDNFQDSIKNYLELTQQTDELSRKVSSNTESSGRFHTDWLNMMYPRLRLARNLLRDDGVILISIDDHEVDNLREVCNEIFGEENFCAQISVINNLKGRNDRKHVATCHEFLLAYAKSDSAELNGLPLTEEQRAEFKFVDTNGEKYALRDLRKRGRPDRREDRPKMWFPIYFDPLSNKCSLEPISLADVEITPKRGDGSDGRWRWGKERVEGNLANLEPRYSKKKNRWDIDHRIYLKNASGGLIDGEEDLDDDDRAEERSSKSKSVWMGGELSTDVGRRTLKDILPEVEYDYPKAVDFIKRCLYVGSDKNSVVIDFFAGSGTTGQAVFEMNSEDGGRRRFILVQMPEPIESGQFSTIAEITKERLRRSAKKVGNGNSAGACDLGFRVFKLDSSNIRTWEPENKDLGQTLLEALEHLKDDRNEMDILYELLLKLGLDLCVPIEQQNITNKTVYSIGAGTLMVCLSEKIVSDEVEALALGIVGWHKQLSPTGDVTCVFRDSAFVDDVAKTNITAILQQNGLENIRSI